mmetsp:Transcript_34131/g.109510  ORF Transcript_34131/g.109510 Transcript_34131/m.109510 type:complete len:262 (-) Transcript_34131:45-830(-)
MARGLRPPRRGRPSQVPGGRRPRRRLGPLHGRRVGHLLPGLLPGPLADPRRVRPRFALFRLLRPRPTPRLVERRPHRRRQPRPVPLDLHHRTDGPPARPRLHRRLRPENRRRLAPRRLVPRLPRPPLRRPGPLPPGQKRPHHLHAARRGTRQQVRRTTQTRHHRRHPQLTPERRRAEVRRPLPEEAHQAPPGPALPQHQAKGRLPPREPALDQKGTPVSQDQDTHPPRERKKEKRPSLCCSCPRLSSSFFLSSLWSKCATS